MKSARTAAISLAVVVLSLPAAAQWSKDAAVNTQISDGAGSEVQPKLVGTDGGSYLSFYDSDPGGSPAFGYDVKLQRLDPIGRPVWVDGGVLVADRGYSSTQDYGLDAGPGGDAWLAFRDDRFSGDQITAARVAPDGSLVWGEFGVQLTSTSSFVAAPKIAALESGGCVVAWSEGSTVALQRLDDDGVPQWGTGLAVPTPSGTSLSLSDLRASGGDTVIFSFISQSGGFFGPRHLRAQKLSIDGVPLWTGSGVNVFNTGSLQIGNFPEFMTDGSGGALFSWYSTSPLQCFAQRVLSDGTQVFGVPGTGAPVSDNAAQIRVNPSAAFDPTTGDSYVFWVEQSLFQSMDGIAGQRFDSAGNRQWGVHGIEYLPVGNQDLGQVRTVAGQGEATVLWKGGPGFGQDEVFGLRVDASGLGQHAIATLASTPSSKDDLTAIRGAFGDAQVAWDGDELGDSDVIAQNLLPSGNLGPAAGSLPRTAGTNVDSHAGAIGALGATTELTLDLTTTGHTFGWVVAYAGSAALPFGTDVVLVDLSGPELLALPVQAGGLLTWSLPLPSDSSLCGAVVSTQGVHIDLALELRLSNALDVYLGLN